MEISAPRSGVVEALDVAVGQEVCHGEILAVIRGDEPDESP
jgi:biotin carboxyl carrier protein